MTMTAPSKYIQLKIDATDEQIELIKDFYNKNYNDLDVNLTIFKCEDDTQNIFYITSNDVTKHNDVLFILSLVVSIVSTVLFTMPDDNKDSITDMDIRYMHDLPEFENSRNESVLLLKCFDENKNDDEIDNDSIVYDDAIITKFNQTTKLIKNEFKDKSKFIIENIRCDMLGIKFIDASIEDVVKSCINLLKLTRIKCCSGFIIALCPLEYYNNMKLSMHYNINLDTLN